MGTLAAGEVHLQGPRASLAQNLGDVAGRARLGEGIPVLEALWALRAVFPQRTRSSRCGHSHLLIRSLLPEVRDGTYVRVLGCRKKTLAAVSLLTVLEAGGPIAGRRQVWSLLRPRSSTRRWSRCPNSLFLEDSSNWSRIARRASF